MPMNRALYPDNWEAIALEIKTVVGWKCEECDRPCRKLGESVEEFAERLESEPGGNEWTSDLVEDFYDDESGEHGQIYRSQRFTLTVAHLDHVPSNCDRSNLKALCAPCHCRYDLKQMGLKKRLKQERQGQLNLFNPLEVNYAGA
jgi:hypothetical protein